MCTVLASVDFLVAVGVDPERYAGVLVAQYLADAFGVGTRQDKLGCRQMSELMWCKGVNLGPAA